MEITVILSQENPTLPQAELFARLETLNIDYEVTEQYLGLIQLKVHTDVDKVIELGQHLSYTHEILQTLYKSSPESVLEDLTKVDWQEEVTGSFKVRVKKMNQGSVHRDNVERTAGGYIKKESQMPVSLDNPECTIKLVYTDPVQEVNEHKEVTTLKYNKTMICKLLVKQDKKHFFDNKPHKRPYFHPGSMSPKLALCMVNLAHVHEADTVLDPFCGTGGILIEAGLLNTRLIGSDIEREMVEGTKLNLSHEKLDNHKIMWEDVRKLEINEVVDAVAMDPPYGISTTLGGDDTKQLYHEALNSIAQYLKDDGYICMASPHYIDLYEVIIGTPLQILEQHEIRMHKSLTRIITVLNKKNK